MKRLILALLAGVAFAASSPVRGRQNCRSGSRRFRRWFRMEAGGGHSRKSRLLGSRRAAARDQLRGGRRCDTPRAQQGRSLCAGRPQL
jgi:hypothetical protein